jgi:hypothetical protein
MDETEASDESTHCASLAYIFDHAAPIFARRALWNIIWDTSDIHDWQLDTKCPYKG